MPHHPYTHTGLAYIDAKEFIGFMAVLHTSTVSCFYFKEPVALLSPFVGICGELPAVQEDVRHSIEARDGGGRALSTGRGAEPAGGVRSGAGTGLPERPFQCSPGTSGSNPDLDPLSESRRFDPVTPLLMEV